MRYSSTAAIVTALVAGSAIAAPSFEQYSQQQQLAFLDPVAEQAAAFLKESKSYVENVSGSVGNVAEKGAKWIQEHINDPRCKSHIAGAFCPSRPRSCVHACATPADDVALVSILEY